MSTSEGMTDLDKRKMSKHGSQVVGAARGMVDALRLTDEGLANPRKRLAELGCEPSPMISNIGNILGSICGDIAGTCLDVELARTRVLALLDAVTDRHRVHLEGKGYMFRIDPSYYTAFWPDADRAKIDMVARIIRAMAMELCDIAKNDDNGVAAARVLLHTTFDILRVVDRIKAGQ